MRIPSIGRKTKITVHRPTAVKLCGTWYQRQIPAPQLKPAVSTNSLRDFGISHKMKLSKNHRCGIMDASNNNHESRSRKRHRASRSKGPGNTNSGMKC